MRVMAYDPYVTRERAAQLGAELVEPRSSSAALMPATGDFMVKVAVTSLSAEIVAVQGPVPLQTPPDQPEKLELPSGSAVKVSVTSVPGE